MGTIHMGSHFLDLLSDIYLKHFSLVYSPMNIVTNQFESLNFDIVHKFYDKNTDYLSQINIPKNQFPRLFIRLFET